MEKPSITRREASLAMLLTIVSVALGSSKAQAGLDAAGMTAGTTGADPTTWGSDGTREMLAESLDAFFGNSTSADGTVREEDKRRIQSNGEYLLADQLRAPLLHIPSFKKILPDESYLYQAFIYRNPRLRCFIKATPTHEIVAAALADTMDVRQNGQLVAMHPRITVFYKTLELPTDVQNDALKVMTDYYSQFAEDASVYGYDIHVFARRLSDGAM